MNIFYTQFNPHKFRWINISHMDGNIFFSVLLKILRQGWLSHQICWERRLELHHKEIEFLWKVLSLQKFYSHRKGNKYKKITVDFIMGTWCTLVHEITSFKILASEMDIALQIFSSTFIHFNLFSFTFTHFHPVSSTSIHIHPLLSTFVHFHPFSSTSIHLIHFHPLSSTFIHCDGIGIGMG